MNICVIQIDALRADHLGCYGYHKNTSPNIDAIAQNNMLFENAIAQSNWTYQSVYSLISGRYPSVLQLKWFDQVINRKFIVLPEFLAERGYYTGISGMFKMLLNPVTFGSHFRERKHIELDESSPSFIKNWLKQHKKSFLFFHIGQYVHEPFYADKSYVDKFLEANVEKEIATTSYIVKALTSKNVINKNKLRGIIGKINKGLIRLKEDELKYLLACYDAGIYYVDRIIGEIHKVIRNESKDYLFILMADHGECFLEHGYFGHGRNLYDEVIKVPLIVDYNNNCNMRVSETVQLVDVYPTILDLLDFEKNFKLDGISFAPVFDGGKLNKRAAVSEGYPYLSIRDNNYKLITVYSKLLSLNDTLNKFSYNRTWKKDLFSLYLHFSPDKLYHLVEDKGENVNLCRKEKEICKSFRNKLKDILDRIQQDSLPPSDVGLDEDIVQQLKTLGYL